MLEKVIHFKNGLPVDAFLSTVENIPLHIHQALEFILVLEGTIEIREAYQTQILNDGNIHIFNSTDLHCITGLSKTNCVLTLYIDQSYLMKFCPEIRHRTFLCDCDNQNGSSIDLLRHMLADIYFHFNENQYSNTKILDADLNQLIVLLLDSFQLFRWLPDGSDHFFYGCPQEFRINPAHADRIHSVQDYIYGHFAENITLGSLAAHEYLSTYYLSHFIRQITGLSFQQWLSSVRCESAEKLLVSTDMTISEIALEVGFASTKYLISHFKKWYGCTPSKYKEATVSLRSHLPHKYYSCDRMKAEKLLNSCRYESSHSGMEIKRGNPISDSLEKIQMPDRSDAAKLQHYVNLMILSGEICRHMVQNDEKTPERSRLTETIAKELSKLAPEASVSYEAFLSEVMRFMKIPPNQEEENPCSDC